MFTTLPLAVIPSAMCNCAVVDVNQSSAKTKSHAVYFSKFSNGLIELSISSKTKLHCIPRTIAGGLFIGWSESSTCCVTVESTLSLIFIFCIAETPYLRQPQPEAEKESFHALRI